MRRSAVKRGHTRRYHQPSQRRVSWQAVRELVLRRDGYACQRCGQRASQVHHLVTRARGGPDDEANLVSLCVECHAVVHDGPDPRFLLRGSFVRGVYRGPDERLRRIFGFVQ